MATRRKHYLTNRELIVELKKSFDQGRLTNEMGIYFIKLVDNIQKKLSYKFISDKQDCASYAIAKLCTYWKNFDMSRSPSNPFSYFSQIAIVALSEGFNEIYPERKLKIEMINLDGFDVLF